MGLALMASGLPIRGGKVKAIIADGELPKCDEFGTQVTELFYSLRNFFELIFGQYSF